MLQQKVLEFNALRPSSRANISPNCSHPPDIKMKPMKRIENYSYCTDEQIGLGCTSKVYKGKNDFTQQEIAVKVINLKQNCDEIQKELLKNEIAVMEKIMKSNRYEHILKLSGVLKTKNNLYLITELCDGKDLGKLLRNRKYLRQAQAHTILSEVIKGLLVLNDLGIVHRDLKLANIFIKNNRMKIADFGFAIESSSCEKALKSEYNVGSPYYMAPQALKFNIYSSKSDIWALGVMAFQLVFGTQPWRSPIDKLLYEKLEKQPIETIIKNHQNSSLMSDHYKQFIIKCLQFEPNNRADISFVSKYLWPKCQPLSLKPNQLNSNKKIFYSSTSLQSNKLINFQASNKMIEIDTCKASNFTSMRDVPDSENQHKQSFGNFKTHFDESSSNENTNKRSLMLNNETNLRNLDKDRNLEIQKFARPPKQPIIKEQQVKHSQKFINTVISMGNFLAFINNIIMELSLPHFVQIKSQLQAYLHKTITNLKNQIKEHLSQQLPQKLKQKLLTIDTHLTVALNLSLEHKPTSEAETFSQAIILTVLQAQIKSLIPKITQRPSQIPLFQKLIYCYQILSIKAKISNEYFLQKSKIDRVVAWILNTQHKNKVSNDPERLKRLIKRCRYLFT